MSRPEKPPISVRESIRNAVTLANRHRNRSIAFEHSKGSAEALKHE
jgi:hypothetical protein